MFSRLFLYDTKAGFRYTRIGCIGAIAIFVMAGAYFYTYMNGSAFYLEELPPPSLGDYYFYIFKGEAAPVPETRGVFRIPGLWLLIQVYLHYMTGFYVVRDLNEQGHQVMLRTGDTWRWWRSKCAWVVGQAALYYLLLMLSGVLCCLASGGSLSLQYHPEVIARLTQTVFAIPSPEYAMRVLLLPFVMAAALCLLQQFIALFAGASLAFVAVCSWLFCSIFQPGNFLVGNYTMLLRAEDASVRMGFLLAGFLLLLGHIGGGLRIKQMDIGRQ